jgi:hypothetical protein
MNIKVTLELYLTSISQWQRQLLKLLKDLQKRLLRQQGVRFSYNPPFLMIDLLSRLAS